jgi:dihydroneopterin aldolase
VAFCQAKGVFRVHLRVHLTIGYDMSCQSAIQIKDLSIQTSIGTYGPEDVVAEQHLLDLTLNISPSLVLLSVDAMQHVFDYDPLVKEIDRLARDGHYETQERLMTRIVDACAGYPEINALTIILRKAPVLNGSGTLGIHLYVDADTLTQRRQRR